MAKLALPKIKLDQEPTVRERIFFLAAFAGIAVLFVNTFWTPKAESIARIHSEKKSLALQVDSFQKLIDTTRGQLAQATAAAKKTPEMNEQVQKILDRRILDPVEEMNATVDQLGGRTLSKRLKVKKIELGVRSDMSGYSVAPITVELSGPYTAVQGYLEAIEGLERALVVRQFDLSRGPESPQELETKLTVDLYVPKP